MHRYLAEVQADYEAEALDVTPQKVMNIDSNVMQEVHDFDDGSQAVVDISEDDYFDVQLQWQYLTEADKDAITDLFYNPFKAKKFKRSFYWEHPTDDNFYTVYFRSALKERHVPGNWQGIPTLTLRVVGLKPTWTGA